MIIHSSGERANIPCLVLQFRIGDRVKEGQSVVLIRDGVSECGLKAEIADRIETNRARVRVVVELSSGEDTTASRSQAFVLKLVKTADTVRLSAALFLECPSCRVVSCLVWVFVNLYPRFD